MYEFGDASDLRRSGMAEDDPVRCETNVNPESRQSTFWEILKYRSILIIATFIIILVIAFFSLSGFSNFKCALIGSMDLYCALL